MSRRLYVCSFCGKDQNAVGEMVTGNGSTAICNECVTTCIDIIQESRETHRRGRVAADLEYLSWFKENPNAS